MSNLLIAQNFTGTYKSNKISYEDKQKSENNYIEETQFNIAISFDERNGFGDLIIQNPRIPDKLITLRLSPKKEALKENDRVYHIYEASRSDGEMNLTCQIVIYQNEEGSLNLLVEQNDSSKMYFNLVKDAQ